ncbi:MAG: extracellular solute-binding protein, partial [Chloroflexi bacterium]|nr:extracellular solute-binding protein [Chloroflexota bacterium]
MGGSLLPNFSTTSSNGTLSYVNLDGTLSSRYPGNWTVVADRGKLIAPLISGSIEETTPSVSWTSRNNDNTSNAVSEKLYQSNAGGFQIDSQVMVGDIVFSGSTEIGRVTQIDRGNQFIFLDTEVSLSSATLKFRRAGQNISQFFNNQAKKNFTPDSKITVQFVDAKPNVGEKLFVLAAANTLPDGSWFGVVADGENGREQAQKGIFKPLDDLIKQDSRFEKGIYFKSFMDVLAVAGKQYAVPIHTHYGTNVLYYNKNLTDAAGVKIPDDGSWTIDEFIEIAKKLTKKEADQWGYWPVTAGMFSEFGAFNVRQFGGEYFDEEGKKLLIDTPESRAGLEWIHSSIYKHLLIDDPNRKIEGAPLGLTGQRGLFAMGKLAMHNTTPGLVAEYKKPGTTEV